MTLTDFRAALTRDDYTFAETLAFIGENYDYQAQAFDNGETRNEAGQNEGSCKLLGLAVLEGLSTEEALRAFGEHYRSVVATPDGSDHANIRNLQKFGIEGVKFEQLPLSRKG